MVKEQKPSRHVHPERRRKAPKSKGPRDERAPKRKAPRAKEPQATAKPRIAILGFGRLGGAIALGLKREGYEVQALPRSGESVRRAAQLGIPLADLEALSESDLGLLAVPDSAVAQVAAEFAPDLGRNTALVHCAGALSLEVFAEALKTHPKRPVGSFHPLCAISSPTDSLEGHAVALSTPSRALRTHLRAMAKALGLFAIQVPEEHRAAYHAGAVMSAGHAVSLLGAACEALGLAGLSEDDAVRALLPLMRSAMRGVEQRGLTRGLTGPIPRGDANVVSMHLNALTPDLREVYRLLSIRALHRLESNLSPAQDTALERALAT